MSLHAALAPQRYRDHVDLQRYLIGCFASSVILNYVHVKWSFLHLSV